MMKNKFMNTPYVRLTFGDVCDTLGKLPANTEGKMQPPWAQQSFSFQFTELPPVEVYEAYGDVE